MNDSVPFIRPHGHAGEEIEGSREGVGNWPSSAVIKKLEGARRCVHSICRSRVSGLSALLQEACVYSPDQIECQVAKLCLMPAATIGLYFLYFMTKR